jgi:hypothetical protein
MCPLEARFLGVGEVIVQLRRHIVLVSQEPNKGNGDATMPQRAGPPQFPMSQYCVYYNKSGDGFMLTRSTDMLLGPVGGEYCE